MTVYDFKRLCFAPTKRTSVWKEEKLACCFRWCFLFPLLSRVESVYVSEETEHLVLTLAIIFQARA